MTCIHVQLTPPNAAAAHQSSSFSSAKRLRYSRSDSMRTGERRGEAKPRAARLMPLRGHGGTKDTVRHAAMSIGADAVIFCQLPNIEKTSSANTYFAFQVLFNCIKQAML